MRKGNKSFVLGDLHGFVQWNPGRSGSTTANVDEASISKRKCFLCRENRPPDQKILAQLDNWVLLENPYPVFQPHYTIVSEAHVPQQLDTAVACRWAHQLPGMVVFYNDPGAGASAPDHAHFQAVPKECLPLIELLDSRWPENEDAGRPSFLDINLPYKIIAGQSDDSNIEIPSSPVNAFFWQAENGSIRFVIIQRKAHRPDLYYLEPPQRRAFSPGAIDMAGVLITPFEEDFKAITVDEIRDIYHQVAYGNCE